MWILRSDRTRRGKERERNRNPVFLELFRNTSYLIFSLFRFASLVFFRRYNKIRNNWLDDLALTGKGNLPFFKCVSPIVIFDSCVSLNPGGPRRRSESGIGLWFFATGHNRLSCAA